MILIPNKEHRVHRFLGGWDFITSSCKTHLNPLSTCQASSNLILQNQYNQPLQPKQPKGSNLRHWSSQSSIIFFSAVRGNDLVAGGHQDSQQISRPQYMSKDLTWAMGNSTGRWKHPLDTQDNPNDGCAGTPGTSMSYHTGQCWNVGLKSRLIKR